MNLKEILEQRKSKIIKTWMEGVITSYADDTARFLRAQNDPFKNPVGAMLEKGLNGVFDQLIKEMDESTIRSFLDPIIRVRAVQNFSPSKALCFIFDLKKAIHSNIQKELTSINTRNEFSEIEMRIDQICLVGFEIYTECRDKIATLKVDTVQKKIYSAFSRAGLVTEASEGE